MVMKTIMLGAVFLISCAAPALKNQSAAPVTRTNNPPPADTEWRWKSEAAKEISERARAANLPDLGKVRLPKDDLEVRVWHGFSIFLLEGFVLRRYAGQWAAIHPGGYCKRRPRSKHRINLEAPKSGWEDCWKKLGDAGLLTLLDASQLGEEPIDPDVLSYVVECNIGGDYRTYHYTNPGRNNREEARRMVRIGEIISEEFELPTLKPK